MNRINNVAVDAVDATAQAVSADRQAGRMAVSLEGEWNLGEGPQFVGEVPLPNGSTVRLEADFPPPLGGTGSAPNPLVYCLWGGVACYAMTYALEASRAGIRLRALRARVATTVDQARALGVADDPPVERIVWELDVDADASREELERIKRLSDERCPGVYCITNPIALETRLT